MTTSNRRSRRRRWRRYSFHRCRRTSRNRRREILGHGRRRRRRRLRTHMRFGRFDGMRTTDVRRKSSGKRFRMLNFDLIVFLLGSHRRNR